MADESLHRMCDRDLVRLGKAVHLLESNVEMADDILLAIQEHFSKPHQPFHECDCANRLRTARMLLREGLGLRGSVRAIASDS